MPAGKFSVGGCNCTSVATLALTIHGCQGPAKSGVSLTATQGGASVAATSNGSGIASFSLPSTGVWTITQSGTTGYRTAVGTVTVVAGANTAARTMIADNASGYYCIGCNDPVLGPFTVNFLYHSTAGIITLPPVTFPASQSGWNALTTPIRVGSNVYGWVAFNVGTLLSIALSQTGTGGVFGTNDSVTSSAFSCGGSFTALYPDGVNVIIAAGSTANN